jgi:Mn2+/Fe2+ NRAMP family transporter
VLNGIVAVPVMVMMMMMAARSDIMGRFVVAGALKWLGWIATAVMAAAVVAMLVTSF